MNYTKGEWKVTEQDKHGINITSSLSSEWAVCRAFGNSNESLANAHLISAAPVMYAALKTIIHGIERDCNEINGNEVFKFHKDSPLAETLKAALAKAEGK